MTRVYIGTLGAGVLQDEHGEVQAGLSATVKDMATGTNATHYSARTGGTSSTGSITASATGTLERWVDPGEYTITVGSNTYDFHAVSGSVESNVGSVAAGTGNATADMATLTAALATSGPKRLTRGSTYLVNAALAVLGDTDLDLNGATVQVAAGATMNGGVFQVINAENAHVRGGIIDLNKANTTDPANDAMGMAVYFYASNSTGIVNCSARDLIVKNGHRIGIRATSSDAATNPLEVTVRGCKVTGCVKRGVYVEQPTSAMIVNNRLSGNCTSDSGGGQIQVTSGGVNTDVLIDGNRCLSAGTDAHGIAVAFCENVRVVNNRCDSNGGAGTNGWGIVISEDVKFFTVANNRCKSNRIGGISIDLATAGSETIKDAHGTISGNVCSNAAVSHGIYVQYAKGVAIVGNHCFSNAGSGILLTDGAQYCTVTGNICRQNSAKGIYITDAGGAVADCGEHIVVGNHCMNNTQSCLDTATLRSKWAANASDTTTSIASATSVTVPVEHEEVTITGTTTITNLVANARKVVTLKFAGILTFTDGVNLILNGNFVTSADDTITLRCDGTNWYEIARSVN